MLTTELLILFGIVALVAGTVLLEKALELYLRYRNYLSSKPEAMLRPNVVELSSLRKQPNTPVQNPVLDIPVSHKDRAAA